VDIYEQWLSSAHRFSSFNNPWYRRSVEYMQEIVGTKAPQWCAGCHDPALLLSGKMDQPVEAFIDTPEANAGLACVACHSVSSTQGTMGNGGLVVHYPKLHALATSRNRVVSVLHDFTLRTNSKPHRRAFLKPFLREQSAEFCSTCHKVHLDTPVNNYRWVRGFNTYDNWQASGVSGEGARSFYQPESPLTCADCHMPLVASDDPTAGDGLVRSHNFAAANTALPTFNGDSTQLALTKRFLEDRQLRVDIFAVSDPFETLKQTLPRAETPQLATSFAIGEEQGMRVGGGGLTIQRTQIVAPLEDGLPVLVSGQSVRVDVVVRTLGLGHFFPSGTVDAQEAWLELKAIDNGGRVLLWSGWMDGDGTGTVDEGAHFYRSLLVDAHSNEINKRNAFASRSTVYVNLIPPGAADVAHYRLDVPQAVGDTVTIVAKLHYRKFNDWHNRFTFSGIPVVTDGNQVSPHYDDRAWQFAADADVPTLPVVTIAADSVVLGLRSGLPATAAAQAHGDDLLRWNDYGIGLLLEGDLKGAEAAFSKVTEIDPHYADGWGNLARVHLREGSLERAESALAGAERVAPDFYKLRYFRGILRKSYADYEAALEDLLTVAEDFPRDRVVLNDIGRVYYLMEAPAAAIPYLERVLSIDPEDLSAHYNLMLCYRALRDSERAGAHEERYLRYKADESASAIARTFREKHPAANNEALPIHEHESTFRR
jgi:tetratricopeptide (TPR) repeat protein